jgi:hypothetical protein
MRIKQTLLILTLLPFLMTPLNADEIEGVVFDNAIQTQDKILTLRGVGLLRYMVVIKAYVGAFYLDQAHQTSHVFEDAPKRLELEYFHSIPASDFTESTRIMIEKNVSSDQLKNIAPQLKQMNALYKDVQPGDRYAATYMPGMGTELALNGKPLGIVPGLEFANAYFSIWLGENPIDKGFRDHLLGEK